MYVVLFVSVMFLILIRLKNTPKEIKMKKKCIFFSKNLVISKKSSTFAATNLPRFPQDQRA